MDVDKRLILEFILEEYDGMQRAGLTWLRIGTWGGML
jgi:hypothetical protein